MKIMIIMMMRVVDDVSDDDDVNYNDSVDDDSDDDECLPIFCYRKIIMSVNLFSPPLILPPVYSLSLYSHHLFTLCHFNYVITVFSVSVLISFLRNFLICETFCCDILRKHSIVAKKFVVVIVEM